MKPDRDDRGAGAPRDRGLGLRALVYALVLPWVVTGLWNVPHGRLVYLAGVLGIAALCAGIARLAPGALGSSWFRAGEVALFNLVLALVLLEVGVRVYLAVGNAPGWLDPSPDVVRYRLDPAQEWLGTRPNSLGFYDGEFREARTPGVKRVVALGDSFAVGIVPFEENYLTLVDQALGEGVELYNMGVCATEVPQYLEILEREGLRFAPDAVLLGFYVGNDIQPAPPSGFFSRAGSRLFQTVRILYTVLRFGSPYTQGKDESGLFRIEADGTRSELPGRSVDRLLAREWKHLERNFRPPATERMRRAWRDTSRALDALIDLCQERGIPLLATIAPDEIQVSPQLFRDTLERHGAQPGDFDLDYPRRRILEQLEGRGVPVLDLTDALAAAEREAPTYHLRALHWNRHGNGAAARALAPWLEAQLERLGSSRASDPPPQPAAE